jgi:heme-degrading monooxygenase HmoA
MILEQAILYIKEHQSKAFEADFKKAGNIINKMPGYKIHQLLKCLEVEDKYLLLVEWETIEDHIIGFRGSEEYQNWKSLLHHYYQPFPVVEHFTEINGL